MKELTVISGKGGSGKTSLVASFAVLGNNLVVVDADVDAADLFLVLDPQVQRQSDFKGGYEAEIDLNTCLYCGNCTDLCQFGAIDQNFVVDGASCEGCGVCAYFCPVEAIDLKQKTCGKWFVSETKFGPMVHAKLGIMEENSGLLVSVLRKEAQVIAERTNKDLIVIDGPPGTGCPVISSITGAHAVLIVTEPTLSGLHDMKRVNELARSLTTPVMVCVNKYDINPGLAMEIQSYAENNHMRYIGSIPYDEDVIAAIVARKSVVEYSSGGAATAMKKIWQNVTEFLSNLHAPIYYPKRSKPGSQIGIM